jgi:Zn-dependent protease with chaperone function
MDRTKRWERVVGRAEFDAKSKRLHALFDRTLSHFPTKVSPLWSVTKIQLRKRGQMKGVVGLTTYCCIETGAKGTIGGERGEKSQKITFYEELLDQLSDDAASGVIAHELAHAWLNEHVKPEASKKREKEADELARRWGYGRFLDALAGETIED